MDRAYTDLVGLTHILSTNPCMDTFAILSPSYKSSRRRGLSCPRLAKLNKGPLRMIPVEKPVGTGGAGSVMFKGSGLELLEGLRLGMIRGKREELGIGN